MNENEQDIGPGALADIIEGLFKTHKMTNKGITSVIQMLAARHNLKATSAFSQTVVSTVRGGKEKKAPPPKKNRSPEETKILIELEAVKKQIKLTGKVLPKEDHLVQERDRLLQAARSFRNKVPKNGAEESKTTSASAQPADQ